MGRILTVLFLCILSIHIQAQISFITPSNPHPNEKTTVTYDSFADSAKFSINDKVFMLIDQVYQNGDVRRTYQELLRDDNVYKYELIIQSNAAYITINFITLSQNSWDPKAELKFMITGRDGKPVRNAHCSNMNPSNYSSEGNEELRIYPDNYSVYPSIWYYESLKQSENLEDKIKKDLEALNSIKDTSLEVLDAKAYGYFLLREYSKSLELIQELISKFPKSLNSFKTLIPLFDQLEASNDTTGMLEKVRMIIQDHSLKNKELTAVWDYIDARNFTMFSDSCIKEICEYWQSKEPDNPKPLRLIGQVFRKQSNFKEAEQIIEKAISLVLEGKLRLYGDIYGKNTISYLAGSCYALAHIRYNLNKYFEALEAIKFGQSISDYPLNKLFQIEGDIWFKLNNYTLAEKAYLEAFKKGVADGKGNLQSCFEKKNNSLDGFEIYLASKLESETPGKKEKVNKAPYFNLTDIQNRKYSLDQLKGKVIVMNFWFMGCTPCLEEIPALNKLVDKYKNKDVVFLAFTSDSDLEMLNRYLKKYPFKYKIIPKASDVNQNYKIRHFPSHVIIDKNGNIRNTIAGGVKDLKEISTTIDNCL